MAKMARVALPPHIHAVTARGKSYYYYQPHRAGARQRIPGEPDSPEWWDTYRRLASLPPPAENRGSFAYLIRAWQSSPEWQAMRPKTQYEWTRYCKRICEAWGNLEVSGLEARHIVALRDKYAATPASTNNLLRCLSSFLAWTVPRGIRSDNPCQFVKKLSSGDPYAPWPMELIELIRDELRPDLWQAAALAIYTGQRAGDVLAMRWDAVRDGRLLVVQEKTRKALSIPLHRDLDAILRVIDRRAVTILTNTNGRPWTKSGFSASWRKNMPTQITEAGLVFHGLRKSAVCMLLEAGCSDAEVSSITGQSRQMVEHYARAVNQERLASAAITKWEGRT